MSFNQVIGQDLAVRILKNALKEKRAGASYLFYGPQGVGKAWTAKQFAKSLNCQKSSSEDSCDACSVCLRIDKREFPDLHWFDDFDGTRSLKIEQVRQLQERISLRPFEGVFKIFVIDNCEVLTLEAANCLLKVLEEPPFDSVIILISRSLNLVIPTIASRCQKIKFNGLSREALESVLNKEHRMDERTSRYLAYYLDGRLGEALELARGDFLGRKNDILDKFIHADNSRELEELFKDKAQGRKTLSILISWFRDILFVKTRVSGGLINHDRASEIIDWANKYSDAQVFMIFTHLTKTFECMEKNINIKLLIDNLRARCENG